MGKHGPCYHCGVTNTPLWRNGPPDKPILCNACGSRWRTKGTLANYTPLHARADPDDYEEHRTSKAKSISINKNKEVKILKRKQNHEIGLVGGVVNSFQSFPKVMDEGTSNRSSSGSAVSNSESCAQVGNDASDLTGPAQSIVFDSTVPSRKRTCVGRPKPSSVEKLTKDLYEILHEQQSSYFSGSSEEDLLFESETPMVSVEIGHGGVLIRHPSSIAREEESEASSLSADNKQLLINEAYSHSANPSLHDENKIFNFQSPGIGKMKKVAGQEEQQEQLRRDKLQHEKLQILGNHNSPLCDVDLKDVLNYDEFMRQLTFEEQQQLIKYLPRFDAANIPGSLKGMFESPQLKENFTFFQQLLAEGVFDISVSGIKNEDCKALKRLVLFNLSKSKWVERYNILKKCKNSSRGSVSGTSAMNSNNFLNVKRSHGTENQNFQEAEKIMKSPKRVSAQTSSENKDLIEMEGSCYSPRNLFALPPDGSSLMESLHFVEESSDQDLLLDVRSHSFFPQAELLQKASSFGAEQASTCSSTVYPRTVHQ